MDDLEFLRIYPAFLPDNPTARTFAFNFFGIKPKLAYIF
jgi:hypothetical protein